MIMLGSIYFIHIKSYHCAPLNRTEQNRTEVYYMYYMYCMHSVFMMTHENFGYYIHGLSVHGHADVDLHQLYEQFQREEDNLCGTRGLEPNSDVQTFEVCL